MIIAILDHHLHLMIHQCNDDTLATSLASDLVYGKTTQLSNIKTLMSI